VQKCFYSIDDISIALPPAVANLLQEYMDVFSSEIPPGLQPVRGIEHKIDLIPGASFPNRAAYRTNPEETKEIQRQVQDLLDRGYIRESLSPCSVLFFWFLRKMALGACVLIVEPLITSQFGTDILFLDWMTCLMN
jgi:hypothetical protein